MSRSFCIVVCALNHQLRRRWNGGIDSMGILSMSPLITATAAAAAAAAPMPVALDVLMETIAFWSCVNRSSFTPETIHTHINLYEFSCFLFVFILAPSSKKAFDVVIFINIVLTIVFAFVAIHAKRTNEGEKERKWNRQTKWCRLCCITICALGISQLVNHNRLELLLFWSDLVLVHTKKNAQFGQLQYW